MNLPSKASNDGSLFTGQQTDRIPDTLFVLHYVERCHISEPMGVSDITLLLLISGCVIWLQLQCTSQSRTVTQVNQHTGATFFRLRNRKSNTIINTASCKRQMCALLRARCFPQCFMRSLGPVAPQL